MHYWCRKQPFCANGKERGTRLALDSANWGLGLIGLIGLWGLGLIGFQGLGFIGFMGLGLLEFRV